MKHKIFVLNIIAIFAFCCADYPQTPEGTPKVNQKDKKEIEKFADEFMTDLKLTNDISQVSEKFFVADFKTRLAEGSSLNFVQGNEELKEQISDSDLYYTKVAFINFFNLASMFIAKSAKPGDNGDENFEGDNLKKYFPPHIVDLMTRSKWLRNMIDDDDYKGDRPENLEDFHSQTSDINTVSDALRTEIIQHKMKFPKSFEGTKYFPGEKCEGETCLDLPENTVIYGIRKYSMYIQIAKVNNELKIVGLFSAADGD